MKTNTNNNQVTAQMINQLTRVYVQQANKTTK